MLCVLARVVIFFFKFDEREKAKNNKDIFYERLRFLLHQPSGSDCKAGCVDRVGSRRSRRGPGGKRSLSSVSRAESGRERRLMVLDVGLLVPLPLVVAPTVGREGQLWLLCFFDDRVADWLIVVEPL